MEEYRADRYKTEGIGSRNPERYMILVLSLLLAALVTWFVMWRSGMAAEGRMQEHLAKIDAQLAAGAAVFDADRLLELTEPVREGQELQVCLRPAGDGYEIVRYELVNTGEWNPDNGLNIWDGGK